MNQEVPQPTTATRSPRRGSAPVWEPAERAACVQVAGCEAISTEVREVSKVVMRVPCSGRGGGDRAGGDGARLHRMLFHEHSSCQ